MIQDYPSEAHPACVEVVPLDDGCVQMVREDTRQRRFANSAAPVDANQQRLSTEFDELLNPTC